MLKKPDNNKEKSTRVSNMVLEIVTSVVLLAVGIAVLITIHVCIVGRAFGRTEMSSGGSSSSSTSVTMSKSSESMSQDDIKKLPCYDFELEDEAEEEKIEDCAVCLDKFKVGDKCRLLPKCNHSFHVQCIDSWLIKTGACPICRTFADFRTATGGDQSSFSNEVGSEFT